MYVPSIDDRLSALSFMKQGLDYEGALTLQSGLANGVKTVMSFDKGFDSIKGVKRIEP